MGAEDGGGRDPGADPYQAGAVKPKFYPCESGK